MISSTTAGTLIGAVLTLTWIVLGFGAFVLVAGAMLVGGFVGRIIDGKVDVGAMMNAVRGRRSSS